MQIKHAGIVLFLTALTRLTYSMVREVCRSIRLSSSWPARSTRMAELTLNILYYIHKSDRQHSSASHRAADNNYL